LTFISAAGNASSQHLESVAYVTNKVCSSDQWSCIAVPCLPGHCYLWSHMPLVHWPHIFKKIFE